MSTAGLASRVTHPVPVVVDPANWRGRALTPVLVFVGTLVAVVSSLGAPLIPALASDYHVSLGSAQWSLTITLLTGAVCAPVVGRLGDGPQGRTVLLTSLGILVAGSVLAALPGSFALLLVGRAGQGVGLALLPLIMGIARDHLESTPARTTVATLSVTAVVGVGLGYPLTGLIAERLSFRAGFWLAAILGAMALAMCSLVVPASSHHARQDFDLPGAVLLGLGLATLLLTVSQGEGWGWTSGTVLGLVTTSLLVITVWVWHEFRVASPIVDLRLMRHRSVLTANVSGILAGVGMYALIAMVIRYVQTPSSTSYGLGASVVTGGLVLLPMSVCSYLASQSTTRLTRLVAPERFLPVGMLIFVLALALFAVARSELWEIFVLMGVAGIAMGCSFAVMPRIIVASVAPSETSSALALHQVLRTIGCSVGSAMSAAVLTAHTFASSPLPTNQGYTVGALIALGMCALTAVISWLLPTRRSGLAASDPPEQDVDLLAEENVDAATAGVLIYEPFDAPTDFAGSTAAPTGGAAR